MMDVSIEEAKAPESFDMAETSISGGHGAPVVVSSSVAPEAPGGWKTDVKRIRMELRSVPKDRRTEDLYLRAVGSNGQALICVPVAKRTEAVCLAAVKAGAGPWFLPVLRLVPRVMRTEAVCLAAVERNGLSLEYTPAPLKTPKMCLAAVKASGGALQFVPKRLRTREICLLAVKNLARATEYVPESIMTPDFILDVATQGDGELAGGSPDIPTADAAAA